MSLVLLGTVERRCNAGFIGHSNVPINDLNHNWKTDIIINYLLILLFTDIIIN